MEPKIEEVLIELDGIFKSRDRTLEVLLGLWLESVLPEQVEGHNLAEADKLPKLCDMFLAWRVREKNRVLKKIGGTKEQEPAKLSAEAMNHLEKFALLRSDLPDDVWEENVFQIDFWLADQIKAQRWSSEGNMEELVPLARKRIWRLGGTDKDLAVIEARANKVKLDDLWRYTEAQNILILIFYAEIRVKEGHEIGQDLLDEDDIESAFIKNKCYLKLNDFYSKRFDQVVEIIGRLRGKLAMEKFLNQTNTKSLLDAEKERDEIKERFDRYKRNLKMRLGNEKDEKDC